MSSTVQASCLCKQNALTYNVSLPLQTVICHCSLCRHSTGNLVVQWAAISRPDNMDSLVKNLTRYESSAPERCRYFCSTCGCLMFLDIGSRLMLSVGSLDLSKDSANPKVAAHIFLEDTKDGGVLRHLTEDRRLKAPLPPSASIEPISDAVVVKGRCHCDKVQFELHSPSSKAVSSESLNPSWHKDNRWHAVHCLCTSCRKGSGSPLQSWAFVPTTHIRFTSPTSKSSMKTYTSSPNIERTFCSTCGATVTFADSARPDPLLVDLAVGLLESKSGSPLAEEILHWDPELLCGYKEDCVDAWWKDSMKGMHEGGMLERVTADASGTSA